MVKTILIPSDTMRAYRACLNCRNRKSKCDLDLNQGRPLGDFKNSSSSSPATQSGLAPFSNNFAHVAPNHNSHFFQSQILNGRLDNKLDEICPWNEIPLSTNGSERICSRQTEQVIVGSTIVNE
ncbi:putative zn2 cys6 dna-binding protein [Golovinomyces cichoracearum]|uniref:Putative zn2 cys6 dna-binding protein n=1 Tax=Golovinomyces cichoracearum TaxID=62708 RepID=A0A420IF89_9PEZI|nr:putative zn2 cys6 dna-binding protein [Golovinomyces cichoracearum]